MLEIAICDKDTFYQNKIKDKLEKYFIRKEIDFNIEIFSENKELIDAGNKIYNMVFTDVDNDNMLHTLAEFLRNSSGNVCIVICSDDINYALEGYKVGAIRYLLKDDFDVSFEECMEAVCERLKINTHGILVPFVDKEKYIHVHKVSYLESKGHYITFFDALSRNEIGKVNSKLDTLQEELCKFNFLRIHKSFLVNMAYISQISGYRCTLKNGVEIPVPKARYKEVKSVFGKYQKH